MHLEIQTPHSFPSSQSLPQSNPQQISKNDYRQVCYRWVVVAIVGMCQLLIGLANNAIVPLQHKMTRTYEISQARVSVSVILSFLVFSISNFPANNIIDAKGLRISFLLGTGLYTVGTLFYLLINISYWFVIIGTIFLGAGQPFLMNSPAKVAAFWFFPKNRAFATAVMVGINLLGVGIGFLTPTLAVKENSSGQQAKSEIKNLYIGYFIYSLFCFAVSLIFMKSKPLILPSEAAKIEKVSSTIQSLKNIKNDQNLSFFFLAYFLSYGTFIAFASNCNFIIKPYGYSDVEIATNAICLMLAGAIGAIAFSLYIKKTFNFSLVIRIISLGSTSLLIILCLWLNSINNKIGTTLIISILGFILTPVVPISYDLGCQIAFPMGQAQVTGLLNGGALLWAFFASTFVASVFGFENSSSSLITMFLLSIFIFTGALLFQRTKIILKRHNLQEGKISDEQKTSPDCSIEPFQTNDSNLNDKKQGIQ